MTTPVLATVGFGAVGGMAEDVVDNDWSFLAADTTSTTLGGIADSIVSFYTTLSTQNHKIAEYFSTHLSRAANAAAINFYDLTGHLDGSPHGSPVYTQTFTIPAAAGGTNWPSETALAVSFMADGWDEVPETQVNPSPPPATIRPRARYRGRFYLGPFTTDAAEFSSKNEPIPSTDLVADIGVAATRFMDERGDFAVWSRADEELRLVAPDGVWWVDNAFDSQRRRGPAATSKTFIWP